MGFPDDSLTEGETVNLHLHPHWKRMVVPTFWSLVAVGAVAATAVFAPFAGPVGLVAVGVLAAILFLWRGFWPWIVWRSTHFVFTTERVLLRDGVIKREQRDIPLARVNDVSSSQTLLDRMVGAGNLTVESAGERGQSVLRDIPGVIKVQKLVYELVEADQAKRTVDDQDLRSALHDLASGQTGQHEGGAAPAAAK